MNRRVGIGVVLIIAGLVGIVASAQQGVKGGGSFMFWKKERIAQSQSAVAEGIRSINVSVENADVVLVRSKSDTIGIRLTGRVSERMSDELSIRSVRQGDTLEIGIDRPEGWLSWLNWNNLELAVELPEADWNLVRMHTGSGDITAKDIAANGIDLDTGSGDLDITNMKTKQAIELHTGSGNITANQLTAERGLFRSGSGNIKVIDSKAAFQMETGSGNIRLDQYAIERDTDLKTGSGDIKIKLGAAPKSLAVDFDAGSGDGRIRWDGFSYAIGDDNRSRILGSFGSGDTLLKVRTGSGDFKLE
ncbi:DUF4097 family beta strand repeat-containing protein [Paenibacillus sp. MMS18-CY102]|uniref:DUF4097 family beta strand repeat-containing protein n=1 Tax=Paenibacillus sp. MMS18-CY102 TaxID=2682849 RepID=UPI001366267A|nr:DUF4097 family beta strand repeat-containing protein [Paenibacillus sp. MMS18-CY102]MWC30004.1 DUF4097 family beta strand repeat protein [Paenibacillus sp. MMS18-CY102]